MPAPTDVYYLLAGGHRWGGETGQAVGSPVTISYSFSTQESPDVAVYNYGKFTPFNATQIAAAKAALNYISSFTNITFVETTANEGKLQFSNNNLMGIGAGGTAPHSYWTDGGIAYAHVVMNNTGETRLDDKSYVPGEITIPSKGGSAWQTLLHEIGHTLGLKHPHSKNGAGDTASVMPADIDDLTATIMSYDRYAKADVTAFTTLPNGQVIASTSLLLPSTFSAYDIGALQYLYGVNTTSTGNKTFTFSPDRPVFMTVSDNGPNNTIDVSALKGTNTIYLFAGVFSDLSISQSIPGAPAATTYDGTRAFSIAPGAKVVNAIGGSGVDRIAGNQHTNKLYGNNGDDILVGHEGDDHLFGGAGADRLEGGADLDIAHYDDADYGNLVINLVNPGLNTGAAAGDTYSGIEGVYTGIGNDRITGDASANILHGKDGLDTIYGGGGNDSVYGGNGNDKLSGDAGFDTLAGGAGADELNGGAGIDYVAYDDGDWGDLLIRLDNTSLNTGAAAGDIYISIEGIIGGVGNDTIYGAATLDTLLGGSGDDMLYGAAGNDSLVGGEGGDRLAGGAGADRHVGGGGGGVDYASYEDANWGNLVISLANPNLNTGAAAGDTYSTIEGIIGGRGNDTIYGDAIRNYLYGRSGNDTLDGGLGNDSLSGQVGADSFQFTTALGKTNVDTINDFVHGEDKILLSQAIFAGIGATLDANEFGVAGRSTLIVYNQSTGQLSYDASGSSSGATPVVFAKVTAGIALDINDFLMIA